MPRLQELHPDQQAVLELVLRRRMAYAQLGGVLGLTTEQVRERALDAVDGLAPDDVTGLELHDRDRIADLLLGQGPDEERAATRELVRSSGPAREWAALVAGELEPLGGPAEPVPGDGAPADGGSGTAGGTAAAATGAGAPAGEASSDAAAGGASEASPDAARPGGVREAFAALDADRPRRGAGPRAGGSPLAGVPRAKLVGGALAALVAVLIVVWVAGGFRGDDGDGGSAEQAAAPTTTTATTGDEEDAEAARQFVAALPKQINFAPPAGAPAEFASAKGVAQSLLSQSSGEPVLALTTENVPKATASRRYFAWADKSGEDPILIGQLTDARGAELPFTGVRLKTGQPAAVDPTVYNRIRITRQTAARPSKPGPTVLVGTLTLRGQR